MATLRNLTIVIEHTGKQIPVIEVDGNMTATELLNVLARKINLPEGTHGVITTKKTHKKLLPTQSLESAGMENGDNLIADFERTAGGNAKINFRYNDKDCVL